MTRSTSQQKSNDMGGTAKVSAMANMPESHVLNDPPAGNYYLVRGLSEIDDLTQKPNINNKTLRTVAEQFDATIVDFHQVKDPKRGTRIDFLRRTRSVWDVVYAEQSQKEESKPESKPESKNPKNVSDSNIDRKEPKIASMEEILNCGPKQIMEDARNKAGKTGSGVKGETGRLYTEENLNFRWLHLSANNLEWMMDLTKRVYRESDKTQVQFRQLAEFIRQSFHEIPGKRPYMTSSCIKDSIPRSPPSAASSQNPAPNETPETQKDPILALYMPYVTFADYVDPNPKDELAEMYAQKNGSKSEAKNDWKILHGSRTLDQFYYHSLEDTRKRDEDQVVTRYINKPKKTALPVHKEEIVKEETAKEETVILRVDHVWLWVIDEKTIITSSTNRLDDKLDPVMEGIFSYLKEAKGKRMGLPPPSSVDKMSKFITTFCIEQIDKDKCNVKERKLSAREIFASTINDIAEAESVLFNAFDGRIKKKLLNLAEGKMGSKTSDNEWKESSEEDYDSIQKGTDLLMEVKDIRDELNILNYLLTEQKIVWEKLLDLSVNEYGGIHWDDKSRKEAEKWKGPGFALRDIIEMDKAAQRIQDSVNSLLGLEQNEANISEAEISKELSKETIRQGRTLMVFTIITIIFLPMSFLTSLFALNITVFPHVDDILAYKPKFIFPIIFSISAGIALPIIDFATKKWMIKLLHWIYSEWIKNFRSQPSTTTPTSQLSTQLSDKQNPLRKSPTAEGLDPTTTSNVEPKLQPTPKAQPSSVPETERASFQNRTDAKDISSSVSQKEDEQHLAGGESNEHHGAARGFSGFLNRHFGSHLGDEEKGLK